MKLSAAAIGLMTSLIASPLSAQEAYNRVFLCDGDGVKMEIYIPESASRDFALDGRPVLAWYALDLSSADRDLRIVHNTLSPSGRYGFAWGLSTGDWTDRTLEKDDRDGSYYARDRSGVENYLVRVSDSEILKRLAGSHFGDRLDYNRWDYRVRWSPDSVWVVEQNDTLLTNAYH